MSGDQDETAVAERSAGDSRDNIVETGNAKPSFVDRVCAEGMDVAEDQYLVDASGGCIVGEAVARQPRTAQTAGIWIVRL
jgi:hypothetical protein